MKRIALFALLLALCTSTVAAATVREIPDVVTDGFASYRALGANAGMKMWLKGSSISVGSEVIEEELRVLGSAEAAFGRLEGYEVLELAQFGSRTYYVYTVIHYERGSIFGRFLVYRARQDWLTQGIRFEFSPEQILPENLFGE